MVRIRVARAKDRVKTAKSVLLTNPGSFLLTGDNKFDGSHLAASWPFFVNGGVLIYQLSVNIR
jgi:hypothetical protein